MNGRKVIPYEQLNDDTALLIDTIVVSLRCKDADRVEVEYIPAIRRFARRIITKAKATMH